jgi:hypothetical protein
MTGDDEPLDLKLAKKIRAEAEAHHKAGEEAFAKAEYALGQADHRHRAMVELEANISRREAKLKELGESDLVAREKAAAAKLKQAEDLMKEYRADYHQAAISLNQINAREKAELGN